MKKYIYLTLYYIGLLTIQILPFGLSRFWQYRRFMYKIHLTLSYYNKKFPYLPINMYVLQDDFYNDHHYSELPEIDMYLYYEVNQLDNL